MARGDVRTDRVPFILKDATTMECPISRLSCERAAPDWANQFLSAFAVQPLVWLRASDHYNHESHNLVVAQDF